MNSSLFLQIHVSVHELYIQNNFVIVEFSINLSLCISELCDTLIIDLFVMKVTALVSYNLEISQGIIYLIFVLFFVLHTESLEPRVPHGAWLFRCKQQLVYG